MSTTPLSSVFPAPANELAPPPLLEGDPVLIAPAPPILLVGDPRLTAQSLAVHDVHATEFKVAAAQAHAALDEFRRVHGFGRGLSAPQIGVNMRFIALNLGAPGPFTMVNPVITARSVETFTMWDDCFSFPWLLVRVRRHASVSVRFTDEVGVTHEWASCDRAVSELLQHEIDHLDGVLALSRALDANSFVARAVYEQNRDAFDAMVDYTIVPTIEATLVPA